ncbi:aminopeptidase [Candidatus Woesearchaeota archaeon]|nr:aminopeptidase [Candidatus Woesearchaeota archaeon]
MAKKSEEKKLQEKLCRKKESAWKDTGDKGKKAIFAFAEGYMDFLGRSKTERPAARNIITMLKKAGFKDINSAKTLKTGDKVYLDQKGKSVICAVIGKNEKRMNLLGAHIDSPRLDLKPNPVFEDKGLAMLKTHYYGGIKKYHWTNVELALHGVIHTKSGKKIEFALGEKGDDPKFIVSDLLPHLAKKQMEKTGSEIIEGEQLNVYVGNIPIKGEDIKDSVKLNVLKSLNKEYGIIEEDFSFAELNFVPAGIPSDIGFDRSMIAGYGHDDKACSYAGLKAIIDMKQPEVTAAVYFSDKEEIGSIGNTGAYSFMLMDFAELLIANLSLKITTGEMLRNSKAISADVSAAINPSFPEVHEESNAALIGHGVVVEKYTGYGGKYSANDASAEYMSEIRALLDKNKIIYQTGEIGKIDSGGGGTIALYLSRYGMDTVDIGPAVLGMHSPREVLSKVDLYETYRLYKAFLENK